LKGYLKIKFEKKKKKNSSKKKKLIGRSEIALNCRSLNPNQNHQANKKKHMLGFVAPFAQPEHHHPMQKKIKK
jgi:hypothetical protein